VIELKRDAMADVVLNQLYRFTPLQTTFGANMVALDGGRPQVMNLKDLLTLFIAFREEVVSRRTKFLLNKARDRAHILVGLAIAVANIDEVIALIRASPDPNEAREAPDGARLAGQGRRAADRADRRSAPRLARTAPRGCPMSRPRPSSICACSA
jgi:DNA gyrase/topoisomerase IV subunit A